MPKSRPYDLILFDLEGTLVDFQWRLVPAVDEILPILSQAGIDPVRYGPLPSYASLYNTTRKITQTWDPLAADRLFDQLTAIYERYDRDALSRWAPYPDTQQVLKHLSDSGYGMGVVTNCGSHAAETVLERFHLEGYFKITLSRDDVSCLKPSPESLHLALKKLGARADQTLFVGDSVNDILAAQRIPMPSCFLSRGESRVTGEDGSMAGFQISSLSGLAHILVEFNEDR